MKIDSDFVRQLIDGSRKIDQMKSEVEQVVKMICGMLKYCTGASHIVRSESFSDSCCKWTVSVSIGNIDTKRDVVVVECWSTYIAHTLAFTNLANYPFHTETAEDVYDSLPVFVAGMLEMFPELEKQWVPMIRAANHK